MRNGHNFVRINRIMVAQLWDNFVLPKSEEFLLRHMLKKMTKNNQTVTVGIWVRHDERKYIEFSETFLIYISNLLSDSTNFWS